VVVSLLRSEAGVVVAVDGTFSVLLVCGKVLDNETCGLILARQPKCGIVPMLFSALETPYRILVVDAGKNALAHALREASEALEGI
jgi:hypothetical protein